MSHPPYGRYAGLLMTLLTFLLVPAGAAEAAVTTLANGAAITVNDNAAASLYPSAVTATGLCGTVSKATLTLNGLTHSATRDIDAMLVSPGGRKLLVLSDAGGAASTVTLTLDDAAAAGVPAASITSGTFKPTNYADTAGTGNDDFPAGVPAGALTGTSLAGAIGSAPNGSWRLFIRDDDGGAAGSFAGGWSLQLTTPNCPVVPPITPGDDFDDGSGGLDPGEEGGGGEPSLGVPGSRAPSMTRFKLAKERFKASKSGGTTVSFTLSRKASVRFTVERKTKGRKAGKRCVARTRANRRRKACTRWVSARGSLTVDGKAGRNSFTFRGRLAGRYLKPGSYRISGKPGSASTAVSRPFGITR